MAKVIVTVSKLDDLAEAVNNLTSATLPLTIDQMTTEITNFTVQRYYVGSATPTASLGSDGDVYLQLGA